ncbi:helix-turn-helix domain-containing protein [Flavobacterium sp.]|uniref:helix-turn-helix transcriptional regulator n=1 Tax=Flavobacterium sp. TaxID=239 RepID=UPI00286C1CF5|nr:helix-turn-helix domain-containing protein [Flavobacterium sp.]
MENILTSIEKLLDSKFSNIQSEYLDIQGACFFLGLRKSTVHKLNHRKIIPYFKPLGSKKCYYLKSDLVEYMTKNRLKSRQEINDEAQRYLSERKGGSYVR